MHVTVTWCTHVMVSWLSNAPRNTASLTNLFGTFLAAISFNQNLDDWNIAGVTELNQGTDVSVFRCTGFFCFSLDTQRCICAVFDRARSFNSPLSSWNIQRVVNMGMTFASSAFNQPLATWDVSNVRSMNRLFLDCPEFNQDTSSWVGSN